MIIKSLSFGIATSRLEVLRRLSGMGYEVST